MSKSIAVHFVNYAIFFVNYDFLADSNLFGEIFEKTMICPCKLKNYWKNSRLHPCNALWSAKCSHTQRLTSAYSHSTNISISGVAYFLSHPRIKSNFCEKLLRKNWLKMMSPSKNVRSLNLFAPMSVAYQPISGGYILNDLYNTSIFRRVTLKMRSTIFMEGWTALFKPRSLQNVMQVQVQFWWNIGLDDKVFIFACIVMVVEFRNCIYSSPADWIYWKW